MTTPMTAEQQKYYDGILANINDDITRMQLRYDSKYLVIALLQRTAYMLQLLQAAKVWDDAEVSVIVQASFAEVFEPIKAPTIMTLQPDGTPSHQQRAS